jgi:tetratricopeptide (TPR) repeat protein
MGRSRASRKRPAPAAAVPEARSGIWWRTLIILLCGSIAYSNSLSGPFIFDDLLSVVQNLQIRQWWRLGAVFRPLRELPVAGRPLVNLSFAINYAFDGLNPFGYHLVNVAVHLTCALVLFGIVRRTLELPTLRSRPGGWSANLAFAAALLWTLHPLNTEAVNYVTQRTELMMALCYLLTLYAGIRAWSSGRARWWYAIAVAASAAGMACKESMATAPLMVIVYDRIFLFGSFKDAVRSRWRLYVGLALSWLVLVAVLWAGPRVHSAGFSSGVSPWTYLLNQTLMITRYLSLTIWPQALVLNYGWPLPLTLRTVLPYALLVTSLMVLTIVVLYRVPKWGFLGAWFFVTLAPASSVIPIATEVGAERRMYLPLIALVVLAVVGASFIKRLSFSVLSTVLVVCAVALGVTTFARNRDYASALQLARTVVARHPTSVAHHLLGAELMIAGQQDEALLELRQAVPGAPRAYYDLGLALFRQEKTTDAIAALQAFVREQPLLLEAVSARLLLGQAFARQQQWLPAIEQYQMVLTMNPSNAQRIDAQLLLGVALYAAGRVDEAIPHYSEYLKARPRDVVALTNLGVALMAVDKPDAALEAFRQVVDVDANNAPGQRNLANALLDHRRIDEAVVHAERAVALQPNDPGALDTLGRGLAMQGKITEAREQFERALRLAPGDPEVRADLAKLRAWSAGR